MTQGLGLWAIIMINVYSIRELALEQSNIMDFGADV